MLNGFYKAMVGSVVAACLVLPASLLLTTNQVQSPPPVAAVNGSSRRRVILMIGDGMGANHRLAGQWSKVGLSGKLAMDSLPVGGWIHTDNVDGAVTDSAAAATAMATGSKTKNGYLGVDRSGATLESILDLASERGMMTGLVATSQVTNATPASFASHITDRSQVLEIASQMLEHEVDIILGGGEGDWLPGAPVRDCNDLYYGKRSDGRNLVAEAILAGYEYVCTPAAFAGLTTGYHQLMGLFTYEKMDRPYNPSLAAMTGAALESLSTDPEGFFLMVEGSQIDSASHAPPDPYNLIDDVKTFDDAVEVARDFVNANPDTLLIVTADHETGGLSIYQATGCNTGDAGPFSIFGGETFCTHFASSSHTGADIPLTAMGPDSHYLDGTQQNTMIYFTMRRYLTALHFMYLPISINP